jgi:hypothetical protein
MRVAANREQGAESYRFSAENIKFTTVLWAGICGSTDILACYFGFHFHEERVC